MTIIGIDIARLSPSLFSNHPHNDLDAVVHSLFDDIYIPLSKTIDSYSRDRLASAIFYRIPQLLGLGRDLGAMNALELGCGRGLKSVPWSTLFRRYWGVDIDSNNIALANDAARTTRRDTVGFMIANVADVVGNPRKYGVDEKIDFVIMYAVLEHFTPSERKVVLEGVREMLSPDGVLLIAETPNRLIPHDGHSTSLHFFQSLPTELAIAYIDRSPRQDAKAVASAADPVEALYRFGMGASYHEFELYFSGADGRTPSIVSDGWDFWQAFDEPIRRDELALADYFRDHDMSAHPAFARFWIEAVFDFSREVSSTTPKLFLPKAGTDVTVQSRPQCWTLDLHSCEPSGRLEFDISCAKSAFLQLNLTKSTGAFGVFDSKDRQLAEFTFEALTRARMPRWHDRCALDVSGYAGSERISFRPIGPRSTLTVEGIIGKVGLA